MSPSSCLIAFLLVELLVTHPAWAIKKLGQPIFGRAGGDDQTVQQTIEDLDDEWVARVEQNSVDSVMELYDDQCVYMPPGGPSATGHTAVEQLMSWINGVGTVTKTIEEVTRMDGSASYVYHRGNFQATNKNGDTVIDGKELIIWKKDGDSYKIHVHMYNKNN
ncbi:uncharacterized protein LOC110979863 [Acanthaster planci]|uniref:Uncharacterized protein LOC110979863 n=1 Tax=Acanthaster planci TaxID=133434 RepID=A0A8B7YEK3_ACAPL|nr:uncharacterized protein LOC110979863 [Acanthaster planci]